MITFKTMKTKSCIEFPLGLICLPKAISLRPSFPLLTRKIKRVRVDKDLLPIWGGLLYAIRRTERGWKRNYISHGLIQGYVGPACVPPAILSTTHQERTHHLKSTASLLTMASRAPDHLTCRAAQHHLLRLSESIVPSIPHPETLPEL